VEGLNQLPNPNKKIDDFVVVREGDVFYGLLDWETGSTLPPKTRPPPTCQAFVVGQDGKWEEMKIICPLFDVGVNVWVK
jgi:hypothetical protein